ncbi:MAG: recombinase RecA [Fretibacterium sp.]|nr:recombinase RecA [Fretibacterium sp.]
MAKKSSGSTQKTRDQVLEDAIDEIRSKYGDGAIMRLGETAKSNVQVIPSGVLPLDVALGIGGYPRGRIVEIFGPEGTGKTTIALCAIAEVQKAGGVAAFIDAEHALDPHLAANVGVNVEALYVSQPDSGEQALYVLDTLVRSGAVDIVVVDSVAALTPKAEIEGNIGESQLGLQARMMSYGLRRLTSIVSKTHCLVMFINQLRAFISSGYNSGPTETTTGGRALKFYSSVRLEVKRGKKIDKGDVTIGHELFLKVVKNKLAPPFRSAHTSLIYGQGIPMGMSVVDMGIDCNVIRKRGSWLAYKGETLGQGKDAVAKILSENPSLQEEIIREIMAEVGKGLGFMPNTASSDDTESDEENTASPGVPEEGTEIEEGILDLSDEDK